MVEKSGERDCERKPENVPQKRARSRRCYTTDPERDVAADQSKRQRRKTDNSVEEIQQDRVSSDPHEGHGPGFPFPDIDDLMRNGEQYHAVAADNQHK